MRRRKGYTDDLNHMNTRTSYSKEWYTPEWILELVYAVMGDIDLDPASCEEAQYLVQAKKFYTAEDDGLAKRWKGRVFLNPPYGHQARKFVHKALYHHERGDVPEALMIVNSNSTDSKWFQPLFDHTLCFSRGRIPFLAPGLIQSQGFINGSCFVYVGTKNLDKFIQEFEPYGNVVRRVNRKES